MSIFGPHLRNPALSHVIIKAIFLQTHYFCKIEQLICWLVSLAYQDIDDMDVILIAKTDSSDSFRYTLLNSENSHILLELHLIDLRDVI